MPASFYSLPSVFLHGISLRAFSQAATEGAWNLEPASISTIRQTILTIILISISLYSKESIADVVVECGTNRNKGKNSMQNRGTQYDRPQVRLLLAVLSWLTTRARPNAARPNADPATRTAIAHHFQLLVLHPASDSIDIEAGIYMAHRAGVDAAHLLACFAGITRRLH
jgi:hypothetical protein